MYQFLGYAVSYRSDDSKKKGWWNMSLELTSLPYADTALEGVISARTISFHYGKHHRAYVDTLNKLIQGTPYADSTLENIIVSSRGRADQTAIFNNAAQVWNHSFYWNCLTPNRTAPSAELLAAMNRDFGSFEACRKSLIDAAPTQFGSGWIWLVLENGRLAIRKTANAETPLGQKGVTPLFTLDVWEHAYYLDYQNLRAKYATDVIEKLVNWDFVSANFRDAAK